MEKKLTYIFGAGASAGALPLAGAFADRLEIFQTYLNGSIGIENIIHNSNVQFLSELNSAIEGCRKNTSIDVYAKQLYLRTENGLAFDRFKTILGCFFLFEQHQEGLNFILKAYTNSPINPQDIGKSEIIDSRYPEFWMKFLTSKKDFLDTNVNILSWNYDLQLEMSYNENYPNLSIDEIQNKLNIYPSTKIHKGNSKNQIVKMNGSAGLFTDTSNAEYKNVIFNAHNLNSGLNSQIVEYLDIYNQQIHSRFKTSLLYFSWEEDLDIDLPEVIETVPLANKILAETEILVIIGYSFPEYNWETDLRIFENVNKLEKVYFQVPDSDFQEYSSKLTSLNKNIKSEIIKNKPTRVFYFPTECRKSIPLKGETHYAEIWK